jgi:hypothetical protein
MIMFLFDNTKLFRVEFYKMLRVVNEHCFAAFFEMPAETFSTLIDAIVSRNYIYVCWYIVNSISTHNV